MHLRLMRCWPHTKKLHMCEADYFLTCNCDVCLDIVRLIMHSCFLECYINIYLSNHMVCSCFLFLLYLFVCVCVCVYIYVCVCVCVYIQGVTGGAEQTSGECSLGQTIPI
jgi:hypothetical protein